MTTGRATKLGCFFILLGVLAAPARAADVSLTAGDAFGTSSFNSAGNWNNAAAPSAGNDYFNATFLLRTPADANDYTFQGDSLTITGTAAGSATGPANDALMYKGTGSGSTITVGDLTINGGQLRHANSEGQTFTLADGGGVGLQIGANGAAIQVQGPTVINSKVSGSSLIRILDAGNDNLLRTVTFASGANTYTGDIELFNARSRFALADTGNLNFVIGASGVNNSIFGIGTAALDGLFQFDLTGASSSPGDSWTIVTASSLSFGSTFAVSGFAQSGDFWTDGTYLFNTTSGILSVSAPPVSWDVDGGGDWSTATNWFNDTPPVAGDDVLFGSVLTAANAPATINLDANASVSRITFGNANQYILSGANTLTLTDLAQLSATSGTHEVAVVIDGSIGLTKSGGGDIILSANNTYTGTTNVQQGALRVRNVGAVDGIANVEAGATLFFQGDGAGTGYNGTFAGDITGAGQVALSNTLTTETVTFNTAKSYTGQTTINGGTLQITGAGTLGASDGTTDTQTRITTGTLALDGVAVGNELLYLDERADAGTAPHLTSSGTSSWAGNIKADIPNTGSHYKLESTSGTLTLSGIISAWDEAAPNDRVYVFDGAGNFNITGEITDLETDAAGDPVAGPVDDGNNVHVVKRGTGTLTISTGGTGAAGEANNFHRGTTVIEEGTLAVVDSQTADAGELFTSSISIRNGATFDTSSFGTYNLQVIEDPDTIPFNGDEIGQTLTGSGTINTGAGRLGAFEDSVITPGDSTGTLTVTGNMSINQTVANPNGALDYELSDVTTVGSGVNDLLAVSGNLQLLADGAAGGPQFKLNVTPTGGDLATTAYTLMTAGNTTGSTATPADFDISLVTDQGTALNSRQDDGAVVAINATSVTVTFSPAQSYNWTGATDDAWDVATTTNWSSSDNLFFDLDSVTFPNGTGQTTVNVVGPVTPGGMTFTNTTDTYTFTGGAIVGTGNVSLGAGSTVVLANDGSNLSGDVSLAATATLQHGDGVSTGSNTLAGNVSGDGAITVASGTLVLSGNNTHTSTTTINSGNLDIESATALGTTAAGTVVNAGGSLRAFGQTFTTNEPVTLNGGTIRVGGGGPSAVTFGGNITVGSADATIRIDGGTGADGVTFTGNITGSGGNALNADVGTDSTATFTGAVSHDGALNKNDPGTMLMADGSSITSPTINVNAGTLDVSAMNGGAGFTLASGQALNNNSNNTVVGDVIAASGSTVSGAGTYANNVTAQSGSTVRVGGAGMPTAPVFTYLDATAGAGGNTALAAGGQFDPVQPGAAAPNVWVVRGLDGGQGSLGNGGSLYQAGPDAVDNAPVLKTTVSGLTPGETYTVYVNYWTATASNWRILAGSSEGSLTLFDADYTAVAGATDGTDLSTLIYDVTPLITEGNRTMWGAPVGDLVANGSGEVEVFIDDSFSGENDPRTWYDGVTYSTDQQVTLSETMTTQGDFTMQAGSTLALDIFSPTVLDLLTVTGNLSAGGTLEVTLDASAPAPSLGDMFDILDFGSASEAFDTFNLPSLASGLVWKTSNLLTTGILEVIAAGLVGDYNNDGIVDARDYTRWRDNLGGDGSALLNRDPSNSGPISEADYNSWKINFGMTIGSGAGSIASAAVPEPSTLLFALLAVCCVPLLRRPRGDRR